MPPDARTGGRRPCRSRTCETLRAVGGADRFCGKHSGKASHNSEQAEPVTVAQRMTNPLFTLPACQDRFCTRDRTFAGGGKLGQKSATNLCSKTLSSGCLPKSPLTSMLSPSSCIRSRGPSRRWYPEWRQIFTRALRAELCSGSPRQLPQVVALGVGPRRARGHGRATKGRPAATPRPHPARPQAHGRQEPRTRRGAALRGDEAHRPQDGGRAPPLRHRGRAGLERGRRQALGAARRRSRAGVHRD